MKLVDIKKREIMRRVFLVLVCMYAGWFLKSRLTPPAVMGMGAMGAAEPIVITQPVEIKDISPAKKYIGIVEAIKSVDLRPQITGYVEEVLFKEGSLVNEGDMLFIIEQERYIANVELRTAELKKAEAHLFQVTKEHKRQASLNKQNYASEAKLENAKSDLLQAQASVNQAKANLDLAKIDLNYTEIKAPISGYIGKALVTEGNYVNSSSQILARIVQNDPVRVAFSMTDKEFLNAKKALETDSSSLRTKLVLPNSDILDIHPISRFADNEANKDTGTVAVYLEYENKNNLLIPGNYVDVLASGGNLENAVLISSKALLQDEHGNFVYAVNKDGLAEQKRVELGGIFENKQIVIKGLNNDDMVIVGGNQKVSDGQKVKASSITDSTEAK